MNNNTDHYFLGVVKFNHNLRVERVELAPLVFVPGFVFFIFISAMLVYLTYYIPKQSTESIAQLNTGSHIAVNNTVGAGSDDELMDVGSAIMLTNMADNYSQNSDIIGWLTIDDTVIDYPVMQTMNDEEYYLYRDFNGNENSAGCLILDTDTQSGSGTLANEYRDGSAPTTNLIIHGHNMKNGSMFGNLDKFKNESYAKEHHIIKYSSLYEEREYEVISVFLSQVYLKSQTDVFKYYKFFNATNEEEFKDFYDNIKKLALFDTGVEAEYGDEFITLSVCAYHVENGRLVVVGRRIK